MVVKMKLSTINFIVETILEQGGPDSKKRANEATIILKTALICDLDSREAATKYFDGSHSEDEYQEFMTEVVLPNEPEN